MSEETDASLRAKIACLKCDRDILREFVEEANHRAEQLRDERDKTKAILSACANAIGNGAAASADCSLEFMAQIPTEIELHISALRSERNALRLVLAQAHEGLSMLVGREMFEDQVDDDLVFLFCGPKVAREVHTLSVKDIRLARAALKAVEEVLK